MLIELFRIFIRKCCPQMLRSRVTHPWFQKSQCGHRGLFAVVRHRSSHPRPCLRPLGCDTSRMHGRTSPAMAGLVGCRSARRWGGGLVYRSCNSTSQPLQPNPVDLRLYNFPQSMCLRLRADHCLMSSIDGDDRNHSRRLEHSRRTLIGRTVSRHCLYCCTVCYPGMHCRRAVAASSLWSSGLRRVPMNRKLLATKNCHSRDCLPCSWQRGPTLLQAAELADVWRSEVSRYIAIAAYVPN